MKRVFLPALLCLAWCLAGLEGCPADTDGDGYTVGDGDCDDSNDTVYPGAPDLCDGLDNDCDGEAEHSCWGSALWRESSW